MKSAVPPLDTEELVRLLHTAPMGILIQDQEGRVSWVNDTLTRLLDLPGEDIMGRTVSKLPLERTDIEAEGGPVYYLPRSGAGEEKWFVGLDHPQEGESSGALSFYVDITEGERARIQVDRLRQALLGQLSTDDRTGLLNRRAVLIQLEAQVSRSRRYQNPLSVLLVRLDCPATAERDIGEQGLIRFSRLLRDQTRWPDIIGRWDEREFLLVLPETPVSATVALKDKVEQQVEILAEQASGPACAAVFGTAEWRKGDDAESLIERVEADLASLGG